MRTKTRLLLSAALCLILSGQPHAASNPTTKMRFHLEAQPLSDAVTAWAKQSGLQLIWPTRSLAVASKLAPKVSGLFSPDEALSLLLAGTGLTYTFVDAHTIAIQSTAAAASDETVARMRLARVDPSPRSGEAARSADEDNRSSSKAEDLLRPSDPVADEIVVTGSHIRGVQNNTVPITILDREYIESTGYTTTTRLIESLPQNFGAVNQSAPQAVSSSAGVLNSSQGTSVNLRAIGQGTTLILLNGRRMAPGMNAASVDISALPLAAIERVEILTDGASALYGSDAVGGVVNFILRKDFDGAETRVLTGWADRVNEYRVGQALGSSWNTGNALVSAEYYQRDLLWAKDRNFIPGTAQIGSLLPGDENYAVMTTGRQAVADNLELFLDALYTRRDSVNFADLPRATLGYQPFDSDTRQIVTTLGLDWRLNQDWRIEMAVNHANNEANTANKGFNVGGFQEFEIQGMQTKADGSLFKVPAGVVSLAIGAEWRDESYRVRGTTLSTGASTGGLDADQNVRSAFAEIYVPIVGRDNRIAGVTTLELSLAGRYDEYSSFGSSLDPQLGLMWAPVEGIQIRASRGRSYKPPNLYQYSTSDNFSYAMSSFDPGLGRTSYQLNSTGADPATFRPQESDSTSLGVAFAPQSVEGFRLGLNYYKIEYSSRLATPAGGNTEIMLNNPAAYSSLITRNPTAAQVNAAIASGQLGQGFYSIDSDFNFVLNPTDFDPASVDVIVDARLRNLSITDTSGLDVSLNYDFDAAGGNIQLGVSGTHILELVQQVTPADVASDSVASLYNPPKWKVRTFAGWQRQSWAANLAVNYTDSSFDTRQSPFTAISSYTTVDARVAYYFRQHPNRLLSGIRLSAAAQNLFDKNPPSTAVVGAYDLGFDPTNASPLGRLISLEFTKQW